MPIELVRSKCPTQTTSTPGTAAISSTAWSPSTVSIWQITTLSLLALRIVATLSPAR
jgi:hypothetical protein